MKRKNYSMNMKFSKSVFKTFQNCNVDAENWNIGY